MPQIFRRLRLISTFMSPFPVLSATSLTLHSKISLEYLPPNPQTFEGNVSCFGCIR
jgi:hypothetical protein